MELPADPHSYVNTVFIGDTCNVVFVCTVEDSLKPHTSKNAQRIYFLSFYMLPLNREIYLHLKFFFL